jgi:hypothetical protein
MNPGWTDVERDEYAEDAGFGLTLWNMAKSGEEFLHPQAEQYRAVFYDDAARALLGRSLRITEGKRGLDTDAECLIYVKCVNNPGGAGAAKQEIEFYRGEDRDGTAGNELVATTGVIDDSDTDVAIVPETGYTLAGTLDTGVLGGADVEFTMHLEIPPAKRALHHFDGTNPFDAQLREAALACIREMRSGYGTARAAAARFAATILDTEIMPTIPARTGEQLLSEGVTVDEGVYAASPSGKLADFRQAMIDNTGGSGAVRAAKGAFSGSVTFPQWQGQATGPTYNHRAEDCEITFRCVKKLGSNAPEFLATRVLTDSRGRPNEGRGTETLSRALRIGCLWVAPEWGIEGVTLNYKVSVTSVTDGLLSTTVADWSVSDLTSSNSSGGIFYPRYDGTTLKFYKTAAGRTALDADDVVASVALATTDDATAFVATGASGLTINGKTGAGTAGLLVSGSTATVDFQVPTITGGSYCALAISETTAPSDWVDVMRKGAFGGQGFVPDVTEGVEVANLDDADVRAGVPGCNVGVSGDLY